MAISMTLTLKRKTLKNVDDAAGRWQHEGGTIRLSNRKVGNYATTRRVTIGGTDAKNTAMLTTTLFFKGKPPQNITLQGSHDFNSGNQIGSVSAASSTYSHFIEGQFQYKGSSNQLRITTT